MHVFYILQGEKGEELEHPNYYELPSTEVPTLAEFRESFPVRGLGSFHFRFRIPTETRGNYMWLDLTDDSKKVPSHNNQVWAKVLALGEWRSVERAAGHEKRASSRSATPPHACF